MGNIHEHLIGKRVLVLQDKQYGKDQTVQEIKILEISPSGQWTKIMEQYGRKFWRKSSSIEPIEILADLEKYPNNLKN